MAEYQLSRREYEALGRRSSRSPSIRIIKATIALATLSVVIGVLLYFGQWLFAVLLGAFLLFALWYAPRHLEQDFDDNDALLSSRVKLAVAADFIRLAAKGVVLQFPYEELKTLWEYSDHFLLYHYCGVTAKIPKSALSEDELRTLSDLQEQLPRIARKLNR